MGAPCPSAPKLTRAAYRDSPILLSQDKWVVQNRIVKVSRAASGEDVRRQSSTAAAEMAEKYSQDCRWRLLPGWTTRTSS